MTDPLGNAVGWQSGGTAGFTGSRKGTPYAAQLATQAWLMPDGPMIPTVGASGGVFGLLLAFGMMYPHQRILLLFPPIPMPAWLFVIGYGALELVLGLSQPGSNVAHFAHLGGMAIGFVLIQYWRGKLPWRPRRILTR